METAMGQASQPALELRELTFAYGAGTSSENTVLRSFSERFYAGQVTALIGPSGCGKTTLLDLIAGLLQPLSGAVTWHQPTRKLGYIFQEYPFLPRKSVAQHVGFSLAMNGARGVDIEPVTNDWLERVGLLRVRDRAVSALSVGMKARVAFATVMIQKPDVVLMDEPFRALDLETKLGLWRQLDKVRRERQSTVILVSHDLNEVIALADAVIVLSHSPCSTIARRSIPERDESDVTIALSDATAAETFRQLWSDLRIAMDGTGGEGSS